MLSLNRHLTGAIASSESMLTLLFLILPLFFSTDLLSGVLKKFQSCRLRLGIAWFSGQLLSTWFVFVVACVSAGHLSPLLHTSVCLCLLALAAYCLCRRRMRDLISLLVPDRVELAKSFLVLIAALTFSACFYLCQLQQRGDLIFKTFIYWDFGGQVSLVQSFVKADNIPPQSELLSGAPLVYHFFFFLLTAVYSIDLDIVGGFNFASIIGFTCVLVLLFGLAEELSCRFASGWIALFLGVASGNLAFVHFFFGTSDLSPIGKLLKLVQPETRPDLVNFVPKAGFNPNMFNLFYFMEERQLIAGACMLLIGSAFLMRCSSFSTRQSLIAGALCGLSALWHIYSVIVLVLAGIFVLLIRESSKSVLVFAMTLGLLSFSQLMALVIYGRSPLYGPALTQLPVFNPTFSTMPGSFPFSLWNACKFWLFAYGLKVLFFPLGLMLLRKTDRRAAIVCAVIFLVSFSLINTIQLAPAGVYDNHKWTRPLSLVMDAVIALPLVLLFREGTTAQIVAAGCLLLMSISGILEAVPYFVAKPLEVFSSYPSEITRAIRSKSRPRDVFVAENALDVLLAGRPLYVTYPDHNLPGVIRLDSAFLKVEDRRALVRQVYGSETIADLCFLAMGRIDYLEIDGSKFPPLRNEPRFVESICIEGKGSNDRNLQFLGIRVLCGHLGTNCSRKPALAEHPF